MRNNLKFIIFTACFLSLGGCASITTRGLPQCSGEARRPLNADLWEWQNHDPAIKKGGVEPAKNAFSFAPVPASEVSKSDPDDPFVNVQKPKESNHWNIKKSFEACGEDNKNVRN